MGERLGVGHHPPGVRLEQVLGVLGHGELVVGRLGRRLRERGQPRVVVLDDLVGPAGKIVELEAVGRQDRLHTLEGVHPLERAEEVAQRLALGGEPRDVGRDRGQQMVARHEDPLGRVEQTQVVFGVAYLNDIDEVRTLPYLAVSWQINDRWRLANPFQAGFSGPAGLELSYQFNPAWNVGLGNSRRTERFLIADDETVVETNEWVSYLRAGWRVTPAIALNLYAGYYFNGELEVTDEAALDLDNQGAAALDLEFRF